MCSRLRRWAHVTGTERPMPSVTKMMTAPVVLEDGDLGREIRVPKASTSSIAPCAGR